MERTYKRSRRLQNRKDTSEQIFMKNLRRSVISMLLCTFCLVSSTWAWFMASAESQLAVIQTKIPTLSAPVSDPGNAAVYARRRAIQKNADGEYRLAAGRYTITADPSIGTAPMYCLIQVRPVEDTEERLEDMIEAFNLDMEQEWIPFLASDSNAIKILESDEELEEFELYIEENMDGETEFEYEILSVPIITEGTYRIEWEPGEERVIYLELAEEAFVSYEIFWMTEEADENEYPNLEALNSYNYAVIYSKYEATPANAAKEMIVTSGISQAGSSSAAVTQNTSATSAPESAASGSAAGENASVGAGVGETGAGNNTMEPKSTSSEQTTEKVTDAANENPTEADADAAESGAVEFVEETPTVKSEDSGSIEKDAVKEDHLSDTSQENQPAIIIDDAGAEDSAGEVNTITPENPTSSIEKLGN